MSLFLIIFSSAQCRLHVILSRMYLIKFLFHVYTCAIAFQSVTLSAYEGGVEYRSNVMRKEKIGFPNRLVLSEIIEVISKLESKR